MGIHFSSSSFFGRRSKETSYVGGGEAKEEDPPLFFLFFPPFGSVFVTRFGNYGRTEPPQSLGEEVGEGGPGKGGGK